MILACLLDLLLLLLSLFLGTFLELGELVLHESRKFFM